MYSGRYKGGNCTVIVEDNNLESAIAKFNKESKDAGVLKDLKVNVLMSREERKAFKKFIRDRRRRKKQARILKALSRLDNYKIIEKDKD